MRNKLLVFSALLAVGILGCSNEESNSDNIAAVNVDQQQTTASVPVTGDSNAASTAQPAIQSPAAQQIPQAQQMPQEATPAAPIAAAPQNQVNQIPSAPAPIVEQQYVTADNTEAATQLPTAAPAAVNPAPVASSTAPVSEAQTALPATQTAGHDTLVKTANTDATATPSVVK